MGIEFRNYQEKDYNELLSFFRKCNEKKDCINWNWGRVEWMFFHSEFDRDSMGEIGLWTEGDTIVAAAVYDMYFGEAFCGTLPGYEYLYVETVGYAIECLKDESGLGIAVCDDDDDKKKTVQSLGMNYTTQDENIMRMDLNGVLAYRLPEGMTIDNFNPAQNPYGYQWLMWQGFDHGNDRDRFEKETDIVSLNRPNLNEELCIGVKNPEGETVAHACLWYNPETDYAYVEPVFTLPEYRNRGLARAALSEGINRCYEMGAGTVYVLSDSDFYTRIGFVNDRHYTFWWV